MSSGAYAGRRLSSRGGCITVPAGEPVVACRAAFHADLAQRLSGMTGLSDVAHIAVEAACTSFPVTDVAVALLHRRRRSEPLASSGPRAGEALELLDQPEGAPLLARVRDEGAVLVGAAAGATGSSETNARAAGPSLWLRLRAGDRVHGILALLGSAASFTDEVVEDARLLADHVGASLGWCRQVTDLQQALSSRHAIGVAQGILMERYGLDKDRAFAVLRRRSQERNLPVRDLAEEVTTDGSL